jgi:hypothetical protein
MLVGGVLVFAKKKPLVSGIPVNDYQIASVAINAGY